MAAPAAHVDGIGIFGPGFPDWKSAAVVLRGEVPFSDLGAQLPAADALPPAERRRVGRPIKLVLAVGQEAAAAAGRNPAQLATVFTASGADGEICHEICRMLATDDRQISPTRFHNSVHNAPAGYWGIAMGAMTPSTSLCALDGSFCAGLLEAVCLVQTAKLPVLLIAYDTGYPEPLKRVRPLIEAFGIALVLAPARSAATLARIALEITKDAADALPDPTLEAVRTCCPAARGLPLLSTLARRETRRDVLDYLDHARVAVTTTPC